MSTLRQRACQRLACSPDEFDQLAFRTALYPHARWLRPLIIRVNPEAFEPDLTFVRHVGSLARLDDVPPEAREFHQHVENVPFARRVLRLRVSARRLARYLHESLHPAPDESRYRLVGRS